MSDEEKPVFDFPTKIRLGYSNVHFRGIFATEDIEKDEIIERCPVAVLAWRTNYQKDPVVWEYMYTNSCPCEECKRHGAHFVMVMGYGQIYNHQDNNNASMNINIKQKLADVVAKRKISKGEEIFVSYGQTYFQGRNKISLDQPNEPIIDSAVGDTSNVIRPL